MNIPQPTVQRGDFLIRTNTNIKGLPEGIEYFTEVGYSQRYPWFVIKRTAKTVTLGRVIVRRDPDWTPEMHVGGFSAHCTNQGAQTWLFDRLDYDYTQVLRYGAKNGWAKDGVRYIEDYAVEFYDYNF